MDVTSSYVHIKQMCLSSFNVSNYVPDEKVGICACGYGYGCDRMFCMPEKKSTG